jgi:predicted DNA-binding transcriptional regulator YafY
MRASRLLSVLLLLQTRGRMTAAELADELEVSVRTIYRDVESLGAAGVPLYGDRGPAGGYRLVDGYRTRLTGLTGDEAESIFLAGLPGPAAELGLGTVLAAAELKLLAALPPELRSRAGRIRERFHLDAPGWFHDLERPTYLAAVAEAAWNQRTLRVRYRRWGGEVRRTLDPLGVVLKGGAWYVVARTAGQIRTYRASRILELEVLDERFERPDGFDLAQFWRSWSEQFQAGLHRFEAVVRLSPRAFDLLPHVVNPVAARAARKSAGPADDDGWREAVLPIESREHAPFELLRLGADVEVLAPRELREQMRATVGALAEIYDDSRDRPAASLSSTAREEAGILLP